MSVSCCTCETAEVLILSCSGASNVGQISNEAAVRLTKEGKGRVFCLAGVGGHVDGIIASCRDASSLIVIDGCHIACAKKTVEHAEIPISKYIVVTGLGIEKNYNFDLSEDEVKKVMEACIA